MKLFLIFLITFVSNICYASDHYTPWKTEFTINDKHKVQSIRYLTNKQINIIKSSFINTEKQFFRYFNYLDKDKCNFDPVNIKIVGNIKELNNKKNFPDEDVYSDKPGKGSNEIFGRYFGRKNNLYIRPFYNKHWRSNFAHELLHYFFDECGLIFKDIDVEHRYIDNFLIDNHDIFY